MVDFSVNGTPRRSASADDTPLLVVLREEFGLKGAKFGCGGGFCGACTVHVDGIAIRSCVTRVADVEGAAVLTIEGLGAAEAPHPLQTAWIEEQVPQCGYCQPGQIMQAAALLAETPSPDREEIVAAMAGNLCRCMTYPRIIRAIERAAAQG